MKFPAPGCNNPPVVDVVVVVDVEPPLVTGGMNVNGLFTSGIFVEELDNEMFPNV